MCQSCIGSDLTIIIMGFFGVYLKDDPRSNFSLHAVWRHCISLFYILNCCRKKKAQYLMLVACCVAWCMCSGNTHFARVHLLVHTLVGLLVS